MKEIPNFNHELEQQDDDNYNPLDGSTMDLESIKRAIEMIREFPLDKKQKQLINYLEANIGDIDDYFNAEN